MRSTVAESEWDLAYSVNEIYSIAESGRDLAYSVNEIYSIAESEWDLAYGVNEIYSSWKWRSSLWCEWDLQYLRVDEI